MARRLLPLAVLAAALLLLGGCTYGTSAKLTSDQEQARVQFIKDRADFTDRELARLCPGLYPRDFLTDEDKYPKPRTDKDRTPPKVTATDREQAAAAGCDVFP